MAISRADIPDFPSLATWLTSVLVPGVCKSVEYDSESAVITITDNDDNVVAEFSNNSNGKYFRAYRGESNYIQGSFTASNLIPYTGKEFNAIGCDNGCIVYVECGSGYTRQNFAFLIAKTNNNKVAFIFPNPGGSNPAWYNTALNHVAWGDSTSKASTTSFPVEEAQQTIPHVFGTNADIGTTSVTPKAFYLPQHDNYGDGDRTGFGKFILNGEEYITNGYWAISCSTV